VFGAFIAVLSFLLVFSEVFAMWDLRVANYFKDCITGPNSALWVAGFAILYTYAIVAIHYSIFRVKIEGFYGLYGDNQTDVSS